MLPIIAHVNFCKSTNLPKLNYRYKQLQYPDEIRLLVISPGTSSDRLDCKLVHTRLSLSPKYEALSYAWGDTSKPRQINCDDRAIHITRSLYTALRHLRDPKKARTLWADAICINQHSNTEKNHQVALMGKIYSQTERGLAWIGEGEDDIVRNAFDYLDRLNAYFCNCLKGYDSQTLGLDYFDMPHLVLTELYTNWIPELYTSLGTLFARPWFRRLWVVQEVVLPKVVEVAFGTRVLPLDHMLNPILVVGSFVVLKNMPDSFDVDALNNILFMGVIRRGRQKDRFNLGSSIPSVILDILRSTQNFATTDRRDKIYGLLGLGYTPGFVADYNLSVNNVFQSFAIWCLGAGPAGLRVLSYAGLSEPKSTLASWIPVGISDNTVKRLCLVNLFHASGPILVDSNSPTTDKTWHVRAGGFLELRGGFIDDIGTIAELPLENDLKESLLALKGILKVAKCGQNVLTEERYHKLCQAMTAELNQFGREASPEQAEWSHRCFKIISEDVLAEEESQSVEVDFIALFRIYASFLGKMKFCLTYHDRFAWIPILSEVGDKICIFQGATVPFVLRPQGDGTHALVGECWVQGLMKGEALSLPRFRWKGVSLI